MQDVYFERSKSKLSLLVFIGICFSGFVIYLVTSISVAEVGIAAYGALLVGSLFFPICTFVGIRMLFTEGGLSVSSEGIVDNSSFINKRYGLVPWADIERIIVLVVKKNSFLSIWLHNSDEYISKLSGLVKVLAVLNNAIYKTPFHISTTSLKTDFSELKEVIEKYHRHYLDE